MFVFFVPHRHFNKLRIYREQKEFRYVSYDQKIKAMKAKEKPYKEFDGDGLHIYVTTKGVKKWRIKYYYRKKEGVLILIPKKELYEIIKKVAELRLSLFKFELYEIVIVPRYWKKNKGYA